MSDRAGNVAVVTGAASGIGLSIARQLASEGMRVVLADVEDHALEAAVGALVNEGSEVLGVRTDVSDPEQVRALADRTYGTFGAVHVLCNNAGVGISGAPVWEFTTADWEWVLGVNLWGVIHGIRAFLPRMIEQGHHGHIVNTSSICGLVSSPDIGPYNASKHAVAALSETLALELRTRGIPIGVSVLAPYLVATNVLNSDRNRPASLRATSSQKASPESIDAMRKWGMRPEDVGSLVSKAIDDGLFYVLTHPEIEQGLVGNRFRDILDGREPSMPQFE